MAGPEETIIRGGRGGQVEGATNSRISFQKALVTIRPAGRFVEEFPVAAGAMHEIAGLFAGRRGQGFLLGVADGEDPVHPGQAEDTGHLVLNVEQNDPAPVAQRFHDHDQ